jgi:hypothetical protein
MHTRSTEDAAFQALDDFKSGRQASGADAVGIDSADYRQSMLQVYTRMYVFIYVCTYVCMYVLRAADRQVGRMLWG